MKREPPRLLREYRENVIPALVKKFNYKNPMQAPRLNTIAINVGVGEAIENAKILDSVMDGIASITGQRPAVTRAKRSISNFKIRQGQPIGCRVTLHGDRMYEFMDRLVSIALPRIRDFRGLDSGSFDHAGNFSVGIKEQMIFPEINPDKMMLVHGMDITFIITGKSAEENREMLRLMGVPFRKKD